MSTAIKLPVAAPRRPYRALLLISAVCGLAVLAAVVYWNKKSHLPAPAEVGTRTDTVQAATLVRSVRLTGTTQAKNFYSLLAPQLRGSRSGRNRSSAGASSTPASSSTSSTASSSSSSSSTSGGSTAASGGASPSGSSTSGGISSAAPSSSSAFQAATSRFGTTLRGSAPANSKSPAAQGTPAATSGTVGATGLGSTGTSLPGQAGGPPSVGSSSSGGGGGGDWQIVLQDVVPPGSRVQKDQIVAEFDRQYMLVRLDDYRASLTESEAALKSQTADLSTALKAHDQMVRSAKADLEKARLDMRTIPVLSAIDAERTRLAFDEAQTRYDQLLQETPKRKASQDAEIRNAELDVEMSKLELKRAEGNADTMVVRAPSSGLAVMETTWRGGEFGKIQKGDQVWSGEPFMKIVDTSSMLVSATVNQTDVDLVRLGAKATVYFDAYPDMKLAAYVDSIGAMTMEGGQRGTYVRQIPVRLRIESKGGAPDPRLIPDLTVSVDVEVGSPVRTETAAPLGAVFQDHGGSPHVYVKEGPGWMRRDVEVGLQNNILVAILKGVNPGDVVALDPPRSPEN